VADERIVAATRTWGPRLLSNGVDPNDFRRVTEPLERWDEWLGAWVANGDRHAQLAREAETLARTRTAGEAWVHAALSYHFARFVWLEDMDLHYRAAARSVAALREAHRLLDPTAERLEIPFEDTTMIATLRRPATAVRPPLVLLLAGLDSTKEEFFHWEEVFLARGLATLSLDGPGQGETARTTFVRPDYEVAVSAALDHLTGCADLDLARVGVVGVSLGGFYASRAAALEPRIRAAVAIAGPFNFGVCWPGLPGLTRDAFVHHSGATDERDAERRASAFDLGPVMSRLQQPLLVIFGKLDQVIPWQQGHRMAAEAPNGELVLFEDGNHVCNNIPYRYRPLAADWISEHLARV
jgi:pimeloyl-ACP methyl ester carboxylesterase